MSKRTKLTSALKAFDRSAEIPPVVSTENQPATEEGSHQSTRTPARRGKKMIAAYFDPAVSRQLKQVGLERDLSNQALIREALNDLFEKHGKPPIA